MKMMEKPVYFFELFGVQQFNRPSRLKIHLNTSMDDMLILSGYWEIV